MVKGCWYYAALAVALVGCRLGSPAPRAMWASRPAGTAAISTAGVSHDREMQSPARPVAASRDLPSIAKNPADKSDLRLASAVEGEAETRANEDAPSPPPGSPDGMVGTLTLRGAIDRALDLNPDLITQREADPVSIAARGVAYTYPFNPYVQVQATPAQWQKTEEVGKTIYNYVLLFQTIQLAHQQRFREDAGDAVVNTVRWNIRQQELLNVAQTQRLYFSALYQRGIRDLAKASNDNNQELLRILEKQLAAGQATAADVAIVRVDARSTQQQAQFAEANYETSLRDFRRQLNLLPDAPIEPAGDLWSYDWQLLTPEMLGIALPDGVAPPAAGETSALVAGLAASRPDVMAARADVDTGRANYNLANASKITDLQIGPYYQRTESGTTYLGFRGQIDLMVIDNRVPITQQRFAELHQRTTAWQQLQVRAELEARAAWERYELAYRMVHELEGFRRNNVPEALLKLEEQFKANEVDVIRVVQGRVSTILNERAHLDLLNELAQSAANLTAAAAIPPEALLSSQPAHPAP
jgi:outer membrane protein TolC